LSLQFVDFAEEQFAKIARQNAINVTEKYALVAQKQCIKFQNAQLFATNVFKIS